MKITIEQDTHTEFVDGKITSDQSTTVEFDLNEKQYVDDSFNRELTEYWTKEFGGRA